MTNLLIIVHVLVCLFLIGIVLLQHGKGADIGASFGGSSQSLFGTEGPVPLLNKITTASAIVFMVTSISLAYIAAHKSTGSVMRDVVIEQPAENSAEPAATTPTPAAEAAEPSAQEAKPKQ
ncbi:MAG: preprotein translocase subunit SecG [Desulfobulbus propionicus]|nr:MAG: preprotein translocase subunit SecG [Desulfobulbus propionicus]